MPDPYYSGGLVRAEIKAALRSAVDETVEMVCTMAGIPDVDAAATSETVPQRPGSGKAPRTLGYSSDSDQGTAYCFEIDGREIEVHVTAKRKLVRVFVGGDEWKKADR